MYKNIYIINKTCVFYIVKTKSKTITHNLKKLLVEKNNNKK